MTEYRDREGNDVYIKDFGTDKLPVGTIIISNRTGAYLELREVGGNVIPVSTQVAKAIRKNKEGNC